LRRTSAESGLEPLLESRVAERATDSLGAAQNHGSGFIFARTEQRPAAIESLSHRRGVILATSETIPAGAARRAEDDDFVDRLARRRLLRLRP